MMKHTQTDPDLPIVYEDEHILVIDKPHNVLAQRDRTGDPDAHTLCKQYLKEKDSGLESVYLGLIHRLDRPAGGLMMFAKTSRAADK
ncbi:MAG: pseudouridine synthase, partial [Balneolaceae bacterium]|nr:pseudouridine synthase [Balneolaceae bacterium]